MTLRTMLKTYRAERDTTQAETAKQFGVPLRTLQNWEAGRNIPSRFVMSMLREKLTNKHRKP